MKVCFFVSPNLTSPYITQNTPFCFCTHSLHTPHFLTHTPSCSFSTVFISICKLSPHGSLMVFSTSYLFFIFAILRFSTRVSLSVITPHCIKVFSFFLVNGDCTLTALTLAAGQINTTIEAYVKLVVENL